MPSASLVSRYTVLTSAARTASGQQELQAVNDYGNVAILVNVTAVAGTTPTMRLSIEDTPDGTTWFPVTTAAADITAAGQYRIFITHSVHGPTNPRVRLRWVIGGTSPSFTFTAIAVSRPSFLG